MFFVTITSDAGTFNIAGSETRYIQLFESGVYTNLINGTDFNITSSASTGARVITYTDAITENLFYNLGNLIVSKCYRRVFPVIYDTFILFYLLHEVHFQVVYLIRGTQKIIIDHSITITEVLT